MKTFLNRLCITMALASIAACTLGIYAPDWRVLLLGVLTLGIGLIAMLMCYVMRPTANHS